MNFDPELVKLLTRYGLDVVGGIVILVVGYLASRLAARAVARATERSERLDPTLKPLLVRVTRITVLVVTLVAVLQQFGVETTSLIAVLGAAGLAIGLALQGALGNVASGVLLLVLRPFGVGDKIEVAGQQLVVDEIGLLTTQAHTFDNVFTMIPNSRVWGAEIRNYSRNETRRVDLVFGIGYGDDMDRAEAIVREICAADPRVLDEPATLVAVGELADSSVNLLARPWVKTDDFQAVKLDLTKRVKERFDREGISIPFPQRDVHLVSDDAEAAGSG